MSLGVPSATRWLLSWLPESGEPENLDEWARSNPYLIPQKPQKQLTAAAAAAQQRYASRWPPTRPGRPSVHGMPQGSPYGRFGKSFPPNLPAPLERRDEEEREQEESSHRGLKRAHSSSGVISEPKRQSLKQQREREQQQERQDMSLSCSSGGETEGVSAAAGGQQWRVSSPVTIPGRQGSGGCEGGRRQLWHLSMENCNEGRQARSESMSGARAGLAGGAAIGGMHGGSDAANGVAATDPASLSRLLDDTVQLLGQSSLMVRQPSAPAIMMHQTCSATVNALNASLSSGSLAAQAAGMEGIEEEPAADDAAGATPPQQGARAQRRHLSASQLAPRLASPL